MLLTKQQTVAWARKLRTASDSKPLAPLCVIPFSVFSFDMFCFMYLVFVFPFLSLSLSLSLYFSFYHTQKMRKS